MRTPLPALLLALAACNGSSKNDVDGDGIETPLDCNDDDPDVKPGVDDPCDGVDNNCDGVVDGGLTETYWPDGDGDGVGDASATPTDACEPPTGMVTNGDDCDDSRADVNPSAEEDCDAVVDRDCDGDPVTGATDLGTFYRDNDGDQYGRDDVTLPGCEAPPGYVADPGDCDDLDPEVFPGAQELCDGEDDDCNGTTDDNAIDGTLHYADADLDGYGDPAVTANACPGVSGYVLDPTDCNDTDPAINPGEDEVCNSGVDDDCDPTTDEDVVDGNAYYVDNDSDTYGETTIVTGCTQPANTATRSGDCDDNDPAVNPGQPELCGGGDENCDGQVDVNPSDGSAYHPDADLDGYGNAASTSASCTPIAGYVLDDTDCNDTSNTTNPGAPELCDSGIDNDCDPTTTDDDSPTAPIWYTDADGDGHGDPTSPVQACTQPGGTVLVGDDCDDAVATTYPGANDLCDGGIDNDCDPSTNEAFTSMWYLDGDADGYGNDAVTYIGCSPPANYIQLPGDCDDTDPALNPTLTPSCIQEHCGLIALSTTWRNTVEHHVTCDVQVQGAARPVLTVQDGSIVTFDVGTGLVVGVSGEGELRVDGTALGVTFTSSEPFPAAGDWDGVTLGTSDRGSSIVGLTVEYAGNNDYGGVYVQGGSPTIVGLTSRSNLGAGLYVTGSEPLVTDSVFTENTDTGVYVSTGAGLSRVDEFGTFGPSFQRNVIFDNRDRPITVPGSHADEIDLSNVLSPNDVDAIGLLAGTLRFTGTWYDHGLPYVVADAATIEVEDGPDAELFIEDGVEVYFGIDADLLVGDGAGGRLEIVDGPDGVILGATLEVILASANWDGLKIGADDLGSILRNLTIEYGGGNATGNLWVFESAPLVDNVVSRDSDSNGIYVSGTTAAPEIRNSSLVDNDENGLYVVSSSGIARSALGPTFVNNVVTGNGQSSVVMPPNFVGELDPSTQFSGNARRIYVHFGDVLEDATWRKLDEDYQILGDVDVGGPQDPILAIEDEVNLWFDRDARLSAGVYDDGAFDIDATIGVLMTSSDPVPGEGDWEGVEIGRNGPTRPQTVFRGVQIVYAGGDDLANGGAVELYDGDGCATQEPLQVLSDLTITSSSKYGLWAEQWTAFSADRLTISGALDGCFSVGNNGCSSEVVSFTDVDCVDGAVFGYWPLDQADDLDPANGVTFPGNVLIDDTLLTATVTLRALPVEWQFQTLVNVSSNVTSPVLTIESGAVLAFQNGAGLEIGRTGLGSIVVQPGSLFTSAYSPAAAGDWTGLRLGPNCVAPIVQGSTIEYGGAFTPNSRGELWIDSCNVGIVDSMTLTDSITCGIYDNGAIVPTNLSYSGNVVGDYCP